MNRSPLKRWRRPKADQVSPKVALEVLERDQGCLALRLDPDADLCNGRLTLDHVNQQATFGRRAPSEPRFLACLCWHHHLDGWASSHRPLLRQYLREVA